IFHGRDGWLFDLSSRIVQVCLMVHVNFKVYQQLLNPTSLRIDYQGSMLPKFASLSNNVAWANRSVWLCTCLLHWVKRAWTPRTSGYT
ncbi:hypothetical protein BKA66DRAFT_425071, partial [Pyrenochaeta sp. MPI-SDFR-AT-0127]